MIFDKILNSDQQEAVIKLEAFLEGPATVFAVSGQAGVGKTYLLKALTERSRHKLIFTAPTNKATKVLREMLTTETYKPDCRTVFSLLGLKLEASGEVKELSVPEDPVDLSKFKAVIVDEGSMCNAALMKYIKLTIDNFDIKFIFVFDEAQAPPVKEKISKVCLLPKDVSLTKVVRHDNPILKLVTRIRAAIYSPAPNISFETDIVDGEGVWSLGGKGVQDRILEDTHGDRFFDPKGSRVIAWRNVTVDRANRAIRKSMFGSGAEEAFLPGDRVLATGLVKDLEGKVVASTDDEGEVVRVSRGQHPIYEEYEIWNLSVTLDNNRTIPLKVLHESSLHLYTAEVERRAQMARETKRLWGKFWEFQEAFHGVRHAYAITSHRSQGSTYHTAFVDWRDILINRNRHEAFQLLYVACSRPSKALIVE